MMNKIALSLLLSLFLVGSVQAESESPHAICAAEADDAGFESAAEKDAYIQDCVQQITQEMGEEGNANVEEPREGDPS